MKRISIRITREQYKLLKILVDEGVYPSFSDALREAVIRLLKEQHLGYEVSFSRVTRRMVGHAFARS